MGLPPAPPPPVPSPGQRPGAIYPPSGTQFRPQPGADLMQGLAAFVKNYRDSKDSVEQHYKQKLQEALIMKYQAGIDISPDDIAKLWKKAGLPPSAVTARTPEDKAFKMVEQMNAATSQGAPGMPALTAGGPMQAPPPQPQIPPGFFQRLKSSLGVGGPPPSGGPGTPLGDFLSRASQATAQAGSDMPGQLLQQGALQKIDLALKKNGLDVSNMNVQQQGDFMKVIKGIIAGDPNALQTGARMNLGKMLPTDELSMVIRMMNPQLSSTEASMIAGRSTYAMQMGLPAMMMKAIEMGEKDAGRFGGNPALGRQFYLDTIMNGQSSIKPTYTPEEKGRMNELSGKLYDAYPSAPSNLIEAAAQQMFNGGSTPALDFLSQAYPRGSNMLTSEQRQKLNFDYWEAKQRLAMEGENIDLSKVKTIIDARKDGPAAQAAWKVFNDPNASLPAKQSAMELLTNANNALTGLKVDYRGTSIPIADPEGFMRGYMHSWQGPAGAMTPGSGIPSTQMPYPTLPGAPPSAVGTTPPPRVGTMGTGHAQSFIQPLMGRTPEEAQAMGRGAGISPNNINTIMDQIRRIQGTMPPPLPTGGGPMTQPQQDDNE